MKYRNTIKSREKVAAEYAELVRQAFDFAGTIFIAADVEGMPNPDRDYWSVHAKVRENVYVKLKIGAPDREWIPTLASLVIQTTDEWSFDPVFRSVRRETLKNREELGMWLTLVWNDLAEAAVKKGGLTAKLLA